ncbi:UvrD-helicase domain-containing protein [Fluviispira multicolorata]|uniref:AAA family ATPase n=1 Tax=Fluviispira multicolorata TaxID=2654512 RepID=A0A833N2L6_9BACT|nr:UvrD-helicase domain-containing protein [Fluviispira multicolorata]KAB8033128.1 AAA family ATPase [Fluviispira multicolorata]
MSLYNEKEPLKIAQKVEDEFHSLYKRIEPVEPWKAYLALKNEKNEFEFRIGATTNKKERIIDWRHPISQHWYNKVELGDEIELEAPFNKDIYGAVAALGKAESSAGNLFSLEWHGPNGIANIIRLEDGTFIELEQTHTIDNKEIILAKPQQEGLQDLISLLTPEQYKLITQKTSEPLIIQGRAGSGKTSVALHRVAWLLWEDLETQQNNNGLGAKTRVLVVMFNRALQNFVSQSIKLLKLEDKIEISTFHSWAMAALDKIYKGEINPINNQRFQNLMKNNFITENEQTKLAKSHAGISLLMEDFVKAQAKKTWEIIEIKCSAYDENNLCLKFKRQPIAYLQDLIDLKKELARLLLITEDENQKNRLEQIEYVVKKIYERALLYKEDLLNLFSNPQWLMKYIPGLTEEDAQTLAKKQKLIQADYKAESAKVGKYIEFDDYALLLRLIQLKRGGLPDGARGEDVFKFDHLVIDEAQDFGAMQLIVLLNSVNSRTGVTIVGDVNQKIAPEKEFVGWDELAKLLNMGEAKVTRLEVGHRSSLPIMWLADHVIESEAILQGRGGSLPEAISFSSQKLIIEHIAQFILNRMQEAPNAHICVVMRYKKLLNTFITKLQDLLSDKNIEIRAGERENFDFKKGVTITNIHQIKGLEFDSVIVADADIYTWPNDLVTRRLLYVAITRAQENFIALCEGQPTRLLTFLDDLDFWKPVERFIAQQNYKPVELSEEEIEDAFNITDL